MSVFYRRNTCKHRRIDEIKAGDYVWAYDTETDTRTLRKVLDVSVTETDVLVHVFTSEGEDIETTMFHPFYVQGSSDDMDSQSGRWVAASNLVSGDKLLMEDGRIIYVDEVRIEKLAESIKVYNLEVEELHTYFVAGGVLVHNGCGSYEEQLDSFDDNKKNHIINGSIKKGHKHQWNLLVPDLNWNSIKEYIIKVMDKGETEDYKSVYSKIMQIGGYKVRVVFNILDDIERISDAWVEIE